MTSPARSARNVPGPHLPTRSVEPIDPAKLYPVRALNAYGIGARTLAAMQRRGFRTLRLGRLKFFRGSDLVAFLESTQADGSDRPEAEQHPERSAV